MYVLLYVSKIFKCFLYLFIVWLDCFVSIFSVLIIISQSVSYFTIACFILNLILFIDFESGETCLKGLHVSERESV